MGSKMTSKRLPKWKLPNVSKPYYLLCFSYILPFQRPPKIYIISSPKLPGNPSAPPTRLYSENIQKYTAFDNHMHLNPQPCLAAPSPLPLTLPLLGAQGACYQLQSRLKACFPSSARCPRSTGRYGGWMRDTAVGWEIWWLKL